MREVMLYRYSTEEEKPPHWPRNGYGLVYVVFRQVLSSGIEAD